MTLPGFTAEAILFRPSANHRARALKRQREVASPAMPVGGGSAFLKCQAECREECFDQGFTPAKCSRVCARACNDSGKGDPVTRPNPINCALSKGGCYAWYAACNIDPFGFGCKVVLDACLKDSGC